MSSDVVLVLVLAPVALGYCVVKIRRDARGRS